jgi:hypothetical protein
LLLLAACGGLKPFDYRAVETRPGPGLVTGPSGQFVILGRY